MIEAKVVFNDDYITLNGKMSGFIVKVVISWLESMMKIMRMMARLKNFFRHKSSLLSSVWGSND